ncbi:MAG: hypothetical protein GWN29_05330 [Gammaproteobacteria bacterium]|nr:hypothetical protein [Gammaproteobacteria bacterium]
MNTLDKQAETELLERSKALFDGSVDGIDGATRGRLRSARERALEELAPRARFGGPRLWIPAVAAAALVALVTLPLMERGGAGPDTGFETMAAADLEILLGEEELEMLAELEFYEWLELEAPAESGSEVVDGVG